MKENSLEGVTIFTEATEATEAVEAIAASGYVAAWFLPPLPGAYAS